MMRFRLNAEGHDESEYLPPGTPSVNAYRAAHGKLEWVEKTLHAKTWMPDKLFELRKIEQEHLDTALCCFLCLMQTLQTLGLGEVKGILVDAPLIITQREAIDTFHALMRELPKPESNMMLWVIRDDRNRGNTRLACHLIGTIKHALENARNIIDKLQEGRRMRDKSSPQLRPESPCPV